RSSSAVQRITLLCLGNDASDCKRVVAALSLADGEADDALLGPCRKELARITGMTTSGLSREVGSLVGALNEMRDLTLALEKARRQSDAKIAAFQRAALPFTG